MLSLLQETARRLGDVLGRESRVVRWARPTYERWLDVSTGGNGIPWTINGHTYRISPFQRHRMGHVYDPEVARFLREHIRPGALCVDVGGNVGVYVLQLARWSAPNGRVVAFEPNPGAADVLAEHIRMNALTERVQIVRAAIAESPGIGVFYASEADGMSRLNLPNPAIADRAQPMRVSVVSLDEFCDEHRFEPDWLVIDVEGFEFAVLAGARRLIARLGHRLGIVVEMHPNAWTIAGWSRESAVALLDELGLHPVSLAGEQEPFALHGHVLLART